MSWHGDMEKVDDYRWRIPRGYKGESGRLHMRTSGIIYADEKLEGVGIRCYVAPGNDDMFELDDLIRSSKHVQLTEGQVVELDRHHEMISSGWSNFTPWHTYREEEEDKLKEEEEDPKGEKEEEEEYQCGGNVDRSNISAGRWSSIAKRRR